MKYLKIKNVLFIAFFSIIAVNLSAMNPKNLSSEKQEKETAIDSAFLRVVYLFTQQAINEKEPILVADTMALNIGKNWSIYYDWNKSRKDSILKENEGKMMSTLKSVRVIKNPDTELLSRMESKNIKPFITGDRNGESAKIFKNRTDNSIITIDNGPSETTKSTYLRVTEKTEPIQWEIADDTLCVLGYSCQKATTSFRGRIYSVWFTMDIPVNDGPWKLYGLPGIILNGKSDDGLFSFEAIGIEQLKDEPIVFPSDKKINDAKNLKQLNDFRKSKRKEVNVGYMENNNMTLYSKRNPIEYIDIEVEK